MTEFYLAALHSIGFSHKNLFSIFELNTDYESFFYSFDEKKLREFWIRSDKREKIIGNRKKCNFDLLKKKLDEYNVQIICIKNPLYPEELKSLDNPPYLIYLRGTIPEGEKFCIVGSRKTTSYAKKAITKFTPHIARHFSIVSGGAEWCDTLAHEETLKYDKPTLAIIGTGIDIDYPKHNQGLYNKVVDSWVWWIISIFPVGTPPSTYTFPVRNELLAAISKGVWVVEGKKKSGTLITARFCLEFWKDLFVLPGDIFSEEREGSNYLLENGAYPVYGPHSILDVYGRINKEITQEKPEFQEEIDEKIYDYLEKQNHTPDELAKLLQTPIVEITTRLSVLELMGAVKKQTGGFYEI